MPSPPIAAKTSAPSPCCCRPCALGQNLISAPRASSSPIDHGMTRSVMQTRSHSPATGEICAPASYPSSSEVHGSVAGIRIQSLIRTCCIAFLGDAECARRPMVGDVPWRRQATKILGCAACCPSARRALAVAARGRIRHGGCTPDFLVAPGSLRWGTQSLVACFTPKCPPGRVAAEVTTYCPKQLLSRLPSAPGGPLRPPTPPRDSELCMGGTKLAEKGRVAATCESYSSSSY